MPDFVVETKTHKLIVELKARKDLTTDDVVAKANAACTWVENANGFLTPSGAKPDPISSFLTTR